MESLIGTQVGAYRCGELLHAGRLTLIYRATDADGVPVVLKLLRAELANAAMLARFREEFELQQGIDGAHVLRASALLPFRNSLCMVLEDFGGISLDAHLQRHELSLDGTLQLSLEIVAGIAEIHAAGLIHKDISLANILWNPASGQLKLADFGIATRLREDFVTGIAADAVEGSLAFISPEQTGRMSRPVDIRSDYYAFGVVLFRLLTGQLPFQADDALQWVHAHLARQPVAPATLNGKIPDMLSALVMKLLAKNPEERYQSSGGILHDLERCRAGLRDNGFIAPFALGEADYSGRLQISKKLYGREDALALLAQSIEAAGQGRVRAVLVRGYSGIGKSALVEEVCRRANAQDSQFLSGKHDQYLRNIPYSALADAMEDHVRQLLAEPEATVAVWRDALLAALDGGAPFLTAVAPFTARLIGEQPEPPEASGPEMQSRIYRAIVDFLQVFAADKPLVLCLEDLQWVDAATLHLVERLLGDDELHNLLLLLVYRDNEVDAGHPLALLLDRLAARDVAVPAIELEPLTADDVACLIADTLHCATDAAAKLAHLVHDKTGGNPFFIDKFIAHLHDEGLLVFDAGMPGWRWDREAIAVAAEVTDNVVELLLLRLNKLPQATRLALSKGSFIGNTFAQAQLAELCETEPNCIATDLQPALQENLVQRFEREGTMYRFQHDRVQEAAASLIAAGDAAALHLRIGETLLAELPSIEREARIFEIAEHLNCGIGDNPPREAALAAAGVDHAAARRGRLAGAYEHALAFARQGRALLPPDAWDSVHELAFNLNSEAQFNAFLSADFSEAERRFAEVLAHENSPVALADCYRAMLLQKSMQGQVEEAVQLGLDILARLGMPISLETLGAEIPGELARFEQALVDTSFDALLERQPIADERIAKRVEVMSTLITTAYFSNFQLSLWLEVKTANLLIEEGSAPGMAFLVAAVNIAYIALRGDYRSGNPIQLFAMELARRTNDKPGYASATHLYSMMCAHWNRPIREVLPYAREAFVALVAVGEVQQAGFTYYTTAAARFEQGEPLGDVVQEVLRGLAYAGKTGNFGATNSLLTWRQTIRALRGETAEPLAFGGDDFDETAFIAELSGAAMIQPLCLYHIYKLELANFFGDAEAAWEHSQRGGERIQFKAGLLPFGSYHFHAALAGCGYLALHREAAPDVAALAAVESGETLLAAWALGAPSSYAHKLALVRAEKARIQGDKWRALENYEAAIRGARDNGFVQEEALAAELAARFYADCGLEAMAHEHFKRALNAYELWGASAKVAALRASREWGEVMPQTAAITSSQLSGGFDLDLETVIRCVEAVTREIDYAKLLHTLLRIVMENAGAGRGALLLERDGALRVVAEGDADAAIRLLPELPLESGFFGAQSVVSYVRRSLDGIVLDDAGRDARFAKDEHIRAHQVKSLLCLPILKQGVLSGMLYLENNLASHVFNPQRVQILQIVAGQAAAAIENASLYAGLEQRVRERTRELDEQNAQIAKSLSLLNESEERFNLFMDTLPAAVFIKNDDGSTVYCNRYMEDVLGYRNWEGKTVYDLYPRELAEQMIADDRRSLEMGYMVTDERVPTMDGQVRLYQTHKFAIPRQGRSSLVGGIALDITERKRAEEALQRSRDELETKVVERTQVLTETSRRLEEEIQTRREMERHLLDVSEEEQARIGRELHDDLGQLLTGAAYLAGALSSALTGGEPEASRQAREIASVIRNAIKRTRYLSHGMISFNLLNRGLAEGLRQLAKDVSGFSGISCRFSYRGVAKISDPAIATHLYRIAQEATNNAIKHSAASHLTIDLRADDREICLVIADDGVGIAHDKQPEKGHMGMMTMDFRAQLIGAQLTMATKEGQGTRITVTLSSARVEQTEAP